MKILKRLLITIHHRCLELNDPHRYSSLTFSKFVHQLSNLNQKWTLSSLTSLVLILNTQKLCLTDNKSCLILKRWFKDEKLVILWLSSMLTKLSNQSDKTFSPSWIHPKDRSFRNILTWFKCALSIEKVIDLEVNLPKSSLDPKINQEEIQI